MVNPAKFASAPGTKPSNCPDKNATMLEGIGNTISAASNSATIAPSSGCAVLSATKLALDHQQGLVRTSGLPERSAGAEIG